MTDYTYKSITLLWHLLTCDSSWKRPAACRSLECTSPAGAPSYKQAIIPHMILLWMLSQDVSSIYYRHLHARDADGRGVVHVELPPPPHRLLVQPAGRRCRGLQGGVGFPPLENIW